LLFHDKATEPVPDTGAKKEKERLVKTLCISNSIAVAGPFHSWSTFIFTVPPPLIGSEDYKVMLQKMIETSKISSL